MAYRQYTKCYQHSPGDKPFHEDDLVGTILMVGGAPMLAALFSFAAGFFVLGGLFMGVGYAATIAYVAKKWLYERLACIGNEPKCAVGVVVGTPKISDFGEFDNDEFFDLRLMPHRPNDAYKDENTAYKGGNAGPSIDGKTENKPENDVYLDGKQGEALMKPHFADLGYDLERTLLHVEAEGGFWKDMLDYALALGLLTGAGGAAGAALGCLICSVFGPVGCIVCAIIGGLAGSAGGAYAGAQAAFHSDPGDVEDANVGDKALGPIAEGDKVVLYGRHVYDGFHEGWHEIHPLMTIVKIHPDRDAGAYLEWDPDFSDPDRIPARLPDMPASWPNLTDQDMRDGLASPAFRGRTEWLLKKWCGLLEETFDELVLDQQETEPHRWTIHPEVDGCKEPPEIK